MEVKCKNCDNYNPEINSCARLDEENRKDKDYLSFVMDDDSCSTEEGAVPISEEEFNRKWLWYLGDREKNYKYIVYLGSDSTQYSMLLGCFDTKEMAIEFATGAILSFTNYKSNRNDIRNQFYETYRNPETKYHEVEYFETNDYVMTKVIGIKELWYHGG